MQQLALFTSGSKERFNELPFWKRTHGWQPEVSRWAVISNMIAYNIQAGRNREAYHMRVIVRRIANGYAVCQTTESWEKACCGLPSERAGQLWHVPLVDLAPYFRQGVIQETD